MPLPEVAAAPGAFAELGTRAAIASGLFWQAVGGAQRLIDGARAELGGACWVVVTGGGARRLAPYLERVDHIDEAWTVRGLLIAAGVGAE